MIGKTISHYKIIEELGRGGMGVVYKAEDTKLNRIVALKFLPQDVNLDPDAKERFIREAQAAAALEHKNICNIFEINETKPAPGEPGDGQTYMVMAYYEGDTLKSKIEKGKLKIEEALDFCTQIAEGLARAHEEGITHRDIKPANIIITNRGEVKILDFGLAKLVGQVQITKDTSTLGTVAYMSPEQCSGSDIDHRSVIWSLGVLFYEMLTGKLPFKGDYEQAVIYAILNEQPIPVGDILPDLPENLEQVVKKALVKNPDERYQQIDQMIGDLQALEKIPQNEHVAKKKSKKLSKPIIGLITIALFIVIVVAIYIFSPSDDKGLKIVHTSPLTTTPGLEQEPTWSPEGTRLAFSSDESGNMDIWVRQIAAGQRVNLTKDHTGYDGQPTWSPDGEWIAFVSERDGGGIFLVSALGGIPKRVVSLSFAASLAYMGAIPTICWSPDGKGIVYASSGEIFKVSAEGGSPVSIPLPPHRLILGYSEPTFSPDGERLACTGLTGPGITTTQIWSMRFDGTDPVEVTSGKTFDINPVWSPDGNKLFFISDRGGIKDVWWMPVDNRGQSIGPAQPLTVGVGIETIAFSKDGLHLAYAKIADYSNIWSMPIVKDRALSLNEATALTAENHFIELLSLSPDGQWIAFDSNRSGNIDLWIMRNDGTELRQFTTHPAHDWAPEWSPDGKKIVFHSLRRGNRDLYVRPVAGGAVTPLTVHPEQDFLPRWSPDGEEIAFFSSRSGNLDIWIIPSEGGEPRQMTTHPGQDQTPIWSPDGKHIAFSSKRTGQFEVFIISIDGGEAMQLTDFVWEAIQPYLWSSDGKTIYASGRGGPENSRVNFWAISTNDGSIRPILNVEGTAKEPNYCLATDGDRFYFPLWERQGDLWMADLKIDE